MRTLLLLVILLFAAMILGMERPAKSGPQHYHWEASR